VLLVALAACAAPVPIPSPELPPVPADAAFFLRQALRFEYGADSGGLDVAVQAQCGVLTIIGFAPFGARAFTLIQRGSELETQMHLPGSWPFPPENIVLDIHRTYLVPMPAQAPADGRRELRHGGEDVRERWEQGLLRERIAIRAGASESRGVRIVYRDGASRDHPSRDVRLENRERGYVLEITSSEYRPLSCSAPLG
jgi:hypothetical protein